MWRVAEGRCPSAAASGCSTAPTTRKCWSSVCTRSCSHGSTFRRPASRCTHLERSLRRHPRHRALPGAQRHDHPQVLSQRLARRAATAVPRPPRRSSQELEVLDQRRRTSACTGTSTCTPTRRPSERPAPKHGPLVRNPGGPQVVHAPRHRRSGDRSAREPRPPLPDARQTQAPRARGSAKAASRYFALTWKMEREDGKEPDSSHVPLTDHFSIFPFPFSMTSGR